MPTKPEQKRDPAVRIPLTIEKAIDGLRAVKSTKAAQEAAKKSAKKKN